MNRSLFCGLSLAATVLLVFSCASRPQMDSYPHSQYTRNLSFSAQVTPIARVNPHHFKGFFLVVKNTQSNPIHILWDKSHYIHKGRPNRGFYVGEQELVAHQRSTTKTTIAPGDTFQQTIWPEVHDIYDNYILESWWQEPMQPGEHGIYLAVRVDEVEIIKEWLSMSIVEAFSD